MPDDPLRTITEAMRKLAGKRLLVGIPGEGEPRSDSAFGNVSRGYVFEFGSPAINMPARPHLVPGVEKAMDEITSRMKAGAKAALDGNLDQAVRHMESAGEAAVNSVIGVIHSGTLQPIKPESYLQRTTGRAARQKRARRKGQTLRELAEAEAASATPLVDTRDYIRNIKWVIRDKK